MSRERIASSPVVLALAMDACVGMPSSPPRDDGIGDVGDGSPVSGNGTDDGSGDTTTRATGDSEPNPNPTAPPVTSDGPGTSPFDSSGAPPVETTSSDTSGYTDPGSDYCVAYAEVVSMCYGAGPGAQALDLCNTYWQIYADYSLACLEAYEDFLVCLSVLDCAAYMSPNACALEDDVVDLECPVPSVERPGLAR